MTTNNKAVTALFLVTALATDLATGQTNVGGAITGNATWTLAGSPYLVTSALSVTGTATLRIDPGVEVRFLGAYGLTIGPTLGAATLLARGTASAPIRFTSAAASPGSWTGIAFGPGTVDAVVDNLYQYVSGSTLAYCDIAFAGAGPTPAIACAPGTPFVGSCTIHDSISGAVLLVTPSSVAVVRECSVYSIAGDGIGHRSGAADNGIRVIGNQLHHIIGCGVSMNLSSQGSMVGMWISDNIISHCTQGIAITYVGGFRYPSPSEISGNEVSDCADTGIVFFGSNSPAAAFRFAADRVYRCRNGMDIAVNGSFIQVSVDNCTLMHNTEHGLLLTYTNFATIPVTDSVIGRNGQGTDGAGVYVNPGMPPSFAVRSAFHRNRIFENRGGKGGGAYLMGSLDIDACEFVANSSVDGGALFIASDSYHTLLSNTRFLGNRASRGDDVFVDLPATRTITANRCSFAGPSLPTHPNHVWDGNDNPLLGKLLFSGNLASDPFGTVGVGLAGSSGVPTLVGSGPLTATSTANFDLSNATPNSVGLLGLGSSTAYQIALGGIIVPDVASGFGTLQFVVGGTGSTRVSVPNIPSLAPWSRVCAQAYFLDTSAPSWVAMSPGVLGVVR